MGWMDGVPLWDHHCHALVSSRRRQDMEQFIRCLTEAPSSYPLDDIRHTLVFQDALRVAGDFFQVEASESEVYRALETVDYERYCRTLFHEAGFKRLLVDTGYAPEDAWTPTELARVLDLPVQAILRLETAAERHLATSNRFDEWIERYLAEVSKARENGYVAAKTIIAYRSGLRTFPVAREVAEERFYTMKRQGERRLTDQSLLNFLLYRVTPRLIEQALPLQFHTGYGDRDTDLIEGNPLLLRAYLETFMPKGHQVVLLHTYPYHREAGYLASVYPALYVDVSLALPLAASGGVRIVQELLELAPLSRVLFASDSHSRPESFFLGAELWKAGVNRFLDEGVQVHRVRPEVAESWAQMIGWENCRRLYAIPWE